MGLGLGLYGLPLRLYEVVLNVSDEKEHAPG